MQPTSSSTALEFRVEAADQLHPWVRALDAFSIPFLCYTADARRSYASRSACELLRDACAGANIGQQADRVVAEELNRQTPHLQIGQFALVRALPACGTSLLLAVHLARPAVDEISAIVVLRPDTSWSDDSVLGGLTARELEVARLIAGGLATKEIAYRLGISSHTARHHTERVFTKLGVRSRAGAAAIIATRVGAVAPAAGPHDAIRAL